MHFKVTLAAAATLLASLCAIVSAETNPTPVSRAEVKAATRAAERDRTLTPAGEGPTFSVPRSSEKTRAQRKAETLAARKQGLLQPAGNVGDIRADAELRARPTQVNRAQRKAETRAAEKAGKLTPAGEGPGATR